MYNQMYLLLPLCFVISSFQSPIGKPIAPQPPKNIKETLAVAKNPQDIAEAQFVLQTNKDINNISSNQTNSTIKPSTTDGIKKGSDNSTQIESGAVIRGVLILVGVSMVFFVYLGWTTCRKKKASIIVRKYGIRARRSDVEMRPLPLDDDEDDETVFDIGILNKS